MGLLNKAQPVRRTVVSPPSARRRVVSVQIADVWEDETRFVFTPVLGNSLRLLRVEVTLQQHRVNANTQVTALFQVYSAVSLPVTLEQVRGCEPVVPIYGAGPDALWRSLYGLGYFEWTMNRLYEGNERRFGLLVNQTEDFRCTPFASFTISEG